MSQSFKNRVFGCAIVKAINANYNADFTKQPRTLPDGTVYATDKVLKYTVRNYLLKQGEKIFFFKRLNENFNPLDLDGTYTALFQEDKDGKDKKITIFNLLSCIDIRLFGATYANKKKNFSLSIHGAVQFTHGVNRFSEGVIYSEQIMSPFADQKENKDKKSSNEFIEAQASTLGTQFKLKEGHYVHHLSINPRNLEEMNKAANSTGITTDDIEKLKEALRNGATFYDSSSKTGVENELLLWVQLKEGSKLVLPSFVELVTVNADKEIDLQKVTALLAKENVKADTEKIEIFYNTAATKVINQPENAIVSELN